MGALSRPNSGCCGHFPLQRNSHDKAVACGGCWRALGLRDVAVYYHFAISTFPVIEQVATRSGMDSKMAKTCYHSHSKHLENEDSEVLNTKEPRVNHEQDKSVNSTNNINTVSSVFNTASIEDNVVDENIVYGCVDDPNMPNLEEIVYSDDDEDFDAEADMTNLDTHILVSPTLTTRIHKDHPLK
ncbi:hypothetical protein Tco_0725205 [Tanacetum coccineum]|uniref:Uncharacterized protein n=1 Tax=Tanacetum coccineum TaxID=301880 RepID=A0ABQ4YC67_9ASTR